MLLVHRHTPLRRSVCILVTVLLLNTTVGTDSTVAAFPVRVIALVTSDVASRYPLLASPSREAVVRVHDIDVLERQRLRFEKEEVDDACGYEVAAEEDKTEGITDTVVGVRGEETDQEVT